MTLNWQSLFQLPLSERSRHRIHLIGIGGTGLAPIAKVLLEMGFQVSGSDQTDSVRTELLKNLGASIHIGHKASHVQNGTTPQRPDLVLVSSAIPDSNPEVSAANLARVPVVNREAILGPLTANRSVIAIAGTHGKTTTTGMIALLLKNAGLDPGYIVGSHVPGLGMSSAGSSDWFVIEADEYDYAFLGLSPTIAILTSMDWDHPDCFPTPASYEHAFRRFLANLKTGGHVVYCGDDPRLLALNTTNETGTTQHCYGTRHNSAWKISNIDIKAEATSYDLTTPANQTLAVKLAVPGLHNVLNSVGALIATNLAGVSLNRAASLLSKYRGADRRFEIKGEAGGVLVIDDYAHHPAEIRSTLAAARAAYPDREIWAVYQPHTYSRTRTFLADFEGVFSAADHVIVTDIYAAREDYDPSISPDSVGAASRHPDYVSISALDDVTTFLLQKISANSIVIILSAGTATQLGPALLERLKITTYDAPSRVN